MKRPLRAFRSPATVILLLALAFAGVGCTPPGAGAATESEAAPLQAIVAITADWDAVDAMLRRFERADADAPWAAVGEPIPAAVGRTGLAWGTGIHGGREGAGPVKREGDGRAPAGIFALSSAFGYAPAAEVPWIRLPYQQATASLECVDDVGSAHYNRIVDRGRIAAPDWNSHEEMRRPDALYSLGVVADHNAAPPVPGGGSCIFLHVWEGPSQATSGCTAFARENLEATLRWLDPAAHPVLIQLPRAEYDRLRASWRLP
ncbi:MAG: hypothetical protein M3409_10695 [Gemmatimonadota bacterium]|jgi:D-alanyl-D-alanine dipeptidase|nr:hypothetical protein [Gemmatimonadota bacterium]